MELIKTCNACPEQYDVISDDKKLIGYICFHFGELEVHPYLNNEDIGFETDLLTKSVNDDYLGVIPDKFREEWLTEACHKIALYYDLKYDSNYCNEQITNIHEIK